MRFMISPDRRWVGTALILALLLVLYEKQAAISQPVFLPLVLHNYGPGKPLQNGSFDQGQDGSWQESSTSTDPILWKAAEIPSDPNFDDITAQSGEWVAWLGGLDNENATLQQRIVIPDKATTLSYYYWIESYESDTDCGGDTATIRLGGNSPLASYDLCEPNNTGGWVRENPVDVSAYRGQTLDLIIQVITDSDGLSNVFFDTLVIATE